MLVAEEPSANSLRYVILRATRRQQAALGADKMCREIAQRAVPTRTWRRLPFLFKSRSLTVQNKLLYNKESAPPNLPAGCVWSWAMSPLPTSPTA